jgi:hypothetical protein
MNSDVTNDLTSAPVATAASTARYTAPGGLLSIFALLILLALSVPGTLGITTYFASYQFTGVEPSWLTQILSLVPRLTALPQNLIVAVSEAVPLVMCRACLTEDQSRLSPIGWVSAGWLFLILCVTVPAALLFNETDPLAIQNLTGGKTVVMAISHACQEVCRVCLLYLGAILGLRAWGR